MTGVRNDPCMADTSMAAVDFMNGGSPKSWWSFTAKRKAELKCMDRGRKDAEQSDYFPEFYAGT
jgi:hypothetical protein